MNKEANKNKLLEVLSVHLNLHDFILNKKTAEFTQRQIDGWNKFQLIFLNRDAGWEINLGMLIRKNIVEDIFHRASSFEPKYHKTTPTLGITIEKYINDNKEYRCHLNSEKDIQVCAEFIENMFKKVALPFFVEYSTLEKMDKAVNVLNGTSIFSGLKYEGNLGLILAKLVANSEYSILLNKYREYYQNLSNGYYLPEFGNLLKVLEALPSGQNIQI